MPKTLINVSNRLPITIGDDDKISKSSGGLVAALEGLSTEEYHTQWIGWPGGVVDPAKQSEIEKKLADEQGCLPIFLTREEADAHYEGFSNSSVWPLFHYMPNYLRYESGWWEEYRKVNQRFADKVLEIAKEGDLVWVHDYQLLLLPAMLKAAKPELRVGFFLHTPFPSYEMFRCHPRRRELIEGMLGADLLGFHTFGYLRHFRSAALRLLGAESDITHVRAADGHRAALGVYPIGINARKFDETLDKPDHATRQQKFRDTFQGKQLVISVERMDYTKGILHRIEAVEIFLAGLEDRDHIKFMFVSVPSREGVEEYQELVTEVESRIGRHQRQVRHVAQQPHPFHPRFGGVRGPVRAVFHRGRGGGHAAHRRHEPRRQGVPRLPARRRGAADPERVRGRGGGVVQRADRQPLRRAGRGGEPSRARWRCRPMNAARATPPCAQRVMTHRRPTLGERPSSTT